MISSGQIYLQFVSNVLRSAREKCLQIVFFFVDQEAECYKRSLKCLKLATILGALTPFQVNRCMLVQQTEKKTHKLLVLILCVHILESFPQQ